MLHPATAQIECGPDGLATLLLAGGQGKRLGPLTLTEAKPAVPFRDGRRIVDFVMANAVRSGIDPLLVCTQWYPETLTAHLCRHWSGAFRRGLQFRYGPDLAGPDGYLGTAHAVACNAAELDRASAREVLILAGDHVYDMDYRKLLATHRRSGRPATVCALPVPLAEARSFGIFQVDADQRVLGFAEKPLDPPPMQQQPSCALASMGIYVFDWPWLRERLGLGRTAVPVPPLDFGQHLLPAAVAAGEVGTFIPAEPTYWRDVGTPEALAAARADFAGPVLPFALPDYPASACAVPPAAQAEGPGTGPTRLLA